jgi:hypothetical protein
MKRVRIMYRFSICLLACTPLAWAGCGGISPPKPADTVQARQALRIALDTWQKGVEPGSLKVSEPPIQVVDHQWRSGYQLVGYQVGGDRPLGANLRCQVQLALKNAKGKPLHKKAVYSIGTSPVLTVVREEDP